ncbi:MAG: glycosyltransferase family 2 protein [Acidimicrobiales bacterium]|jgi:cellulose synthase (UDP-forming)
MSKPTTDAPAAYKDDALVIRGLVVLALVWGAAYLVWRAADTGHGAQPVMFFVLLACELFGWTMLASFAFLAWRVPISSRPAIERRPTVDVFVCTYDEGLDILVATLVGCDRITYPHTTWVLDDGHRDEVADLAGRFGARYLTRSTNEHAKAGNINNALGHTDGQLILVLDADHVPQPDILDATVGYFDDASVALVQTPHDFGNHDSFQHFETGRHDQSMFFEVIMPGKDRHDGAFWCGSATVIRRQALEGIGGIATETVAEDFHTTIRLHGQGWHTRYHDETLVQGLAPHDLATFLLQRDRWARGNLSVLRTAENPLIAPKLTIKQRVSYLSSLLAYFVPLQRLAMLAVLVAMLVSGRLPLHATLWQFCVFWLPWMALNLAASALLCRGQASLWDGAYSNLLTTEIFTRAAFVLVHPFRTSFKVTPKDGIDDGGWSAARQLRLVLVMAGILAAAVVARVLALLGLLALPALGGLAVVAGISFAVWELVVVAAALWRVTRRHQVRRHYRVPVEVAGVVGGTLVRVVDLTPGGAGMIGSHPFEVGAEVDLRLDLPSVAGEIRVVRVVFTVCSSRPAPGLGWRMGGTLFPASDADGEALIEHCHVVSSRSRLTDAGRLVPGGPAAPIGGREEAVAEEAGAEEAPRRRTSAGA